VSYFTRDVAIAEPLTLQQVLNSVNSMIIEAQQAQVEPTVIVPPSMIIGYARAGLPFYHWTRAETMRRAKGFARDEHLKLTRYARTQKHLKHKAARREKRRLARYAFALRTGKQ
jgi:hypothetical protein